MGLLNFVMTQEEEALMGQIAKVVNFLKDDIIRIEQWITGAVWSEEKQCKWKQLKINALST